MTCTSAFAFVQLSEHGTKSLWKHSFFSFNMCLGSWGKQKGNSLDMICGSKHFFLRNASLISVRLAPEFMHTGSQFLAFKMTNEEHRMSG